MLNYDRNVTDFRPIEGHRSGVDVLCDRRARTVSNKHFVKQYKAA